MPSTASRTGCDARRCLTITSGSNRLDLLDHATAGQGPTNSWHDSQGGTRMQTEQEAFWAGDFGNEYVARNRSDALLASNVAFFTRILEHARGAKSYVELGANVGMNLRALKALRPDAELTGLELNATAYGELAKLLFVDARHGSMLEDPDLGVHDLSFTKGVLIHIAPEALPRAYALLHRSSRRYVLVCEYYNPSPVSIPYRGHVDKLFKRDFAGEMMDAYSDLELVGYGFAYRRDSMFPQDDISWFLMEKRGAERD
jgi:pseudaminic acid biosynthesis-associated methylase